MASPAATPISLKIPGLPWGGTTTLSKTAPGQFTLLENCYVSSDGKEIRTFPGYVCVIDPETQQWSNAGEDTNVGYRKTHFDAHRSVWSFSGGYYYTHNLAPAESLRIWTEPTTLHCIEQMGGLWRIVGESDFRREPIYNAARTLWVRVAKVSDSGTKITIELNEPADVTPKTFNAVWAWTASTPPIVCRVWLTGITGTLAAALNDKGHVVEAIILDRLVLKTTTTAAVTEYDTEGFIAKVTETDNATSPISDDIESLTTWTCLSLGDPDSDVPIEAVHPAHVANRQRDFADTASGGTAPSADADIIPGCKSGVTNYPRSRRRQKALPYRVSPDVAGNRLLLAAPGYSCVFQVPAVTPINYNNSTPALGLSSFGNDIYDRPRSLGVPKAVCYEDPDKTVGTSFHNNGSTAFAQQQWGGAAQPGRAGIYKFKFAYQDNGTGEVGLCSEPITVTSDGAGVNGQKFDFLVMFPGYLLHECLALSVNVYRTKAGGTQFYFDRTIVVSVTGHGSTASSKYGLYAWSSLDEFAFHLHYIAEYQSDTDLEEQTGFIPDTIEQMPMGCKAVRTIRNFTFFGGALGNAGKSQHLRSGTLSMNFDRVSSLTDGFSYNHDEVGSLHRNDFAFPVLLNVFEGAETDFGCAGKSIPPAYQGQMILSRQMFPYPRTRSRLDLLVNTVMGWIPASTLDHNGRRPDIRYRITDTPLVIDKDYGGSTSRLQTAYIELPQGQLQISEPDNPNIVPATNTTPVSNEQSNDIEGIGDAGGHAVVCTKNSTYYLGFSQSPIGATPEIASDQFGCISANSMVSFESGCAWMSDRGPCMMLGGFQWIGEPLQKFFMGESARYLTDSKGMMRHSWSCYDPERGLLYFGVFANRFAGTANEVFVNYRGSNYTWAMAADHDTEADQIQSRFPCDEVLVYSFKVGAWSVWRPPSAIAIQWMTLGYDDNGKRRVFFLGNDRRIYALDDAFGLFQRDISKEVPLETGTVSTLTVTDSAANRVGVPVLVCYDAKPGETRVKYQRTIASVGVGTITLDSAVTLTGSEWLVIGARSMSVHSTFLAPKSSQPTKVDAIGMRYDMWSTFAASGVGIPQSAFYKMSTVTTQWRDNIRRRKEEVLTAVGDEPYLFTGFNLVDEPVLEARRAGSASGYTFQVKLDFVGSAQVRLHDIYAEVE